MLIKVRILATQKKPHTHTKQMLYVTLNLKVMITSLLGPFSVVFKSQTYRVLTGPAQCEATAVC